MLRILHAPINVAGQPATISRAQRKIGLHSDVLIFGDDKLHYEHDYSIHLSAHATMRMKQKILLLKNLINKYDIFHFHYASSFLPYYIDLRILRSLKKKVFMHYWGSDVIQTDVAKEYTAFTTEEFMKNYPHLDNNKRRAKLAKIEKLATRTIVGDYSLLPFSPNSTVVRQALDISKFAYHGINTDQDYITILHAPTNRVTKGTMKIISVVKELQRQHKHVRFMLVENVPHDEAVQMYTQADIIVDDIKQGPYGILAIECMALGKVVINRIDSKMEKYYPHLPIINANAESLHTTLSKLISQTGRIRKLGEQGRKYVEANHDSIKIAREISKIYES